HSRLGAALALAAGAALTCAHAQPAELPDAATTPLTSSAIKVVFVIAMENHDAGEIYGNTKDAPYLNNTLLPAYSHATNFTNELPSLPSEPHYVWMEAGTNKFTDHTFTGDGDATKTNSTKSKAHLATQIRNASSGITWMAYQEGITNATGA